MTRFPVLALFALCACHNNDDSDSQEGAAINGRLTAVDGRDVLHLWGKRDEIGYAEGALLCGRITLLYQDFFLDYLMARSGSDYAAILAQVQDHAVLPEGDVRELQGIIAGMQAECAAEDLGLTGSYIGEDRDITYEDLLIASVLPDWACSSVTVWEEASAVDGTIHARNLDYYVDPQGTFLAQHLLKILRSDEQGGARWASVSVPGLVGCISCFTEEGVGLTMHDSSGLAASESTFTPRVLAARAAVAATWGAADPVLAAEAVLEQHGQDMGNNLHMSLHCDGPDCQGGAVLEYDGDATHADGRVTVRTPGQSGLQTSDAIACTNHYLSRSQPQTTGDSARRLATLVAGLDDAVAQGGLTPTTALDLVAEVADGSTAHTVVMDTSSMQLSLYVGAAVNQPAPEATPVVFDLRALFDALPAGE